MEVVESVDSVPVVAAVVIDSVDEKNAWRVIDSVALYSENDSVAMDSVTMDCVYASVALDSVTMASVTMASVAIDSVDDRTISACEGKKKAAKGSNGSKNHVHSTVRLPNHHCPTSGFW
jgi:hypothetical protein